MTQTPEERRLKKKFVDVVVVARRPVADAEQIRCSLLLVGVDEGAVRVCGGGDDVGVAMDLRV